MLLFLLSWTNFRAQSETKVPKSAKMEPQRRPRAPFGCQSDPQVTQKLPKGSPRRSQGVLKEPKRSQKAAQSDHQAPKKVGTLSKLGFVHRRSVFETLKLKVDYLYYVFSSLEVLIFIKSHENTAPAMLLEPPWAPLHTPTDHQKPVNLCSPSPPPPHLLPYELRSFTPKALHHLQSRFQRAFRNLV